MLSKVKFQASIRVKAKFKVIVDADEMVHCPSNITAYKYNIHPTVDKLTKIDENSTSKNKTLYTDERIWNKTA